MKKLELKQMQELLVDYVLNRISDEDKILFEQNLGNYPEIEEELIQSRKLFQRIEQTDFDKITSGRTRNTAYKVRNRYKIAPSKSEKRVSFATKVVIPTLGLAAMILLMITTIDFSNLFSNRNYEIIPTDILSDINIESYQNTTIPSNIFAIESDGFSDEVSDDIYAEYELDYVGDIDISTVQNINSLMINDNYNYFNEINEEEFQNIYEDIKNENFDL